MSNSKKLLIIAAVLVVVGAALGGGLYLAYPVQVSTIAGLSRNFIITLGSPAGTVTTETNPAYQSPVPLSSIPTAEGSPNPESADWPSYNRTVMSQRYSPVSEINTTNVGRLKVLCTYDLHELAAFESGLIMVNNARVAGENRDSQGRYPRPRHVAGEPMKRSLPVTTLDLQRRLGLRL